MKFNSTDEAFKYVKDNEIEPVLLNIGYNNDRGYAFCITNCYGFCEKDGQYFARIDLGNTVEDFRMDVTPERYNELKPVNHRTRIAITRHLIDNEDVLDVIIPANLGEISKKDMENTITDLVIRDIIKYFGIRTSGAIRKLSADAGLVYIGSCETE